MSGGGLFRRIRSLGFAGVKETAGESLQEDLRDRLIGSDVGRETAQGLAEAAIKAAGDAPTPERIASELRTLIEKTISPLARSLETDRGNHPHVVMVVGANGSGKTTTLAKLAHRLRREGRGVLLAACDTFRAAAVDQLERWAERAGVPVVTTRPGGDAAALAHEAVGSAREKNIPVVLIDTAGRQAGRADLMAELEKMVRVLRKLDSSAPHDVLLVLDAATGRSALEQVDKFSGAADVTGLVVTKLDGTARAGVLLETAARFPLPVHFVSLGEGMDDLQPLDAAAYAAAIVGED